MNSARTRRQRRAQAPVTPQATPRDELCWMVSGSDPASRLWAALDAGHMKDIVPELPALRMEQDPIHRHKDVLAHTVAVVAKAPDDLLVRMAALFHDIGKPLTRRYHDGEVTFRHHEAVGAKMTRVRLKALDFDEPFVTDVSELVRLSGRFKGYSTGWSDSAVRRYARDAGPLLGRLNQLVRSDCTTRSRRKEAELHRQIDDLERRIAELAEQARRDAERPGLNGNEVMEHLGIGPGPHVGRALKWLLEHQRAHGVIPRDDLLALLDGWWTNNRPT